VCFTGCSKKKSSTTADEWVQTKPVSPESEPVRNWLQSIKARDVELFKTVFSKRMQAVMGEQGWGRSLGVYTFLWTDKLGDYDIDELDFSFTPDTIPQYGEMAKTGTVTVSKDGNAYPPIDVIFENGLWKVNER
jgi:hypothetical protein